ncbi:hypothetical protein GCM10022219_27920 [Microbacterium oryzae]|uniref:Uncharacterized protein n=1 Tax=Microbacterium oryzae TaxID=743009 RepID=A0A6I6DQQ9_9MICO|nr:hypothetical protein [Microbacterium oryzae]QGU27262.1 hypothetical protein D7D94_05975 [Microbacterium oryzae]
MRITRPLALAASAAVLAVTLTACSGQQGGEQELSWEDSPLSEYMAAAYGTGLSVEEQQAKADEETRKIEELTAECMQAEGFEYIPNVQNGTTIFSEDDDVWDPESREWVEQYGYGIFNDPYGNDPQPESEEYVDPNQEYVESLSESEQSAYSETLYGAQPSEDEMNDPEFDWDAFYETADLGCSGEASDEVSGMDTWEELNTQFEPLLTKMDELYLKVQEAPELVELDAAWSACMAEAGFPSYSTQADPSTELGEKQSAFWDEQNAAYEEIDWETVTEEEIAALDAQNDPSTKPEWKELAEQEIEVALADLECREETDYRDETMRVQFALEEQFIADNEADLEAYRAAAEQMS